MTMQDFYPFNKQVFDRWIRDNSSKDLRTSYENLSTDSIIIDCGGFKGEWAEKMHSKYGCKIIIFEPIPHYQQLIKERFKGNNDIEVLELGVSKVPGIYEISIEDDASSLHHGKSISSISIKTINLIEFLSTRGIDKVDLVKMNIEGSEYEMLEDIIDKKKSSLFSNIQVQFHRFVKDCYQRRNLIRESLSQTHALTYDYEFVWENWQIK
jgi:FkbM family methyltransferase